MNFKVRIDFDNLEEQIDFLCKIFTLYDIFNFENIDSVDSEIKFIKNQKDILYFYIENDKFCSLNSISSEGVIEKFQLNEFKEVIISKVNLEDLKLKRIDNSLIIPENIKVTIKDNLLTFYEIQTESK